MFLKEGGRENEQETNDEKHRTYDVHGISNLTNARKCS